MLSNNSPYKLSDAFGDMSEEDVNFDVERFFIKYTVEKGTDSILEEDMQNVFFLYMCQYLIHKDFSFSEKLN